MRQVECVQCLGVRKQHGSVLSRLRLRALRVGLGGSLATAVSSRIISLSLIKAADITR